MSETAVEPVEFWMGLRFKRGDRRVLAALIDRAREQGPAAKDHLELFSKALDSLNDGEPLVVRCSAPSEAYEMAAAFSTYGLTQPEVQDFSAAHRRV